MSKGDLAKMADAWLERAEQERAKGHDAFHGGKALAYMDCAAHLRWFLSVQPDEEKGAR